MKKNLTIIIILLEKYILTCFHQSILIFCIINIFKKFYEIFFINLFYFILILLKDLKIENKK